MPDLDGQHYDTVIIGAGMSGIAAGIRLAHFGRRVAILEKHEAPGGLNSFYRIDGRNYDVGLHALTNFAADGEKGKPFTKLLRQLRLSRNDFDLSEQRSSLIHFPDSKLSFSNDPSTLSESVSRQFPAQSDAFERLRKFINSYDDTSLAHTGGSARTLLAEFLSDTLLIDMLLLPLLYYGSARENDIDAAQFVTMFKSIYEEGFSRPFDGVRTIIKTLLASYKKAGGERYMRTGVSKLVTGNGRVNSITLDNGNHLTADHIISCAGHKETLSLCTPKQNTLPDEGKLSFVETIYVMNKQPDEFGWEDTIIFFSRNNTPKYERPNALIDTDSGVICFPNNYRYPEGKILNEGQLRITALANYDLWKKLSNNDYTESKLCSASSMLKSARSCLSPVDNKTFEESIIAQDIFTPQTIERFTGHCGGAVYGAPNKIRDGRTCFDNLYLCGTDQGFLGIIGAVLSGISMANLHVLK